MTTVTARRSQWHAARRMAGFVSPFLVILAMWFLIAWLFTDLRVIPNPVAVVVAIVDDFSILPINISITLSEAGIGYLVGNALAILLAVVFVQVPWVERLLMRIAVASYCIPLVAIAPILVIVLPGDVPKQVLAGLCVFFTTVVAALLGLRSSDAATEDVIRSLGGSSWQTMKKVRLRAMLPSTFAGLAIAAPAALLGAIIGEYLGSSSGLGVLLVQAQSSFEVPRTWGIALVMSLLAGLVYALVVAIGRWATPWASKDVSVGTGARQVATGSRWRSFGTGAAGLIGSIVIIVAAWYGAIALFKLNPYFAKTPLDVWNYLITDPAAAANRSRLWGGLLITLGDAGVGYVVGITIACLVALLVVTFPRVERLVMPAAIVLRSIPLVALTPLLALIFGRGLLGVTVIVSIITFFATLVNVIVGLRSAPELACDVVRSLGGNTASVTRKVRLSYALPSLFASARIAIPGALAGATLAEWLATGQGLGAMLVQDYAASRFGGLWAESVIIVSVSVLLYALLGAIERPIAARFASQSGG